MAFLQFAKAFLSKGDSPQSTTQTTAVDGAASMGAKVKAAPAGQRRSSTPSISISKFLPQSSASQKDVKFKDKRYKPLGDVVNSITKSFASILSIFKADDKLSRQQADDQRIQDAEDVKTARESKLEGQNKFSPLKTISNKISQSGSWLDRLITFIASIALGSLVMAIYKNFTAIIQFFKDAYTSIVDFFKRLGDYMSPIWDVFKFLVNPFSGMYSLMNIKDDGVDWASKVSEKIKETEEGMGLTETELANQLDVEMEEEEKPNQGGNPMMNFLDSFWQRMIFPAGFLMGGAKAGTLEGNPIREDRSFARGMIKIHEGLKLKAYNDEKGNLTVGYGHKIDADSPPDIRRLKLGDSITSQRAEELFEQDFSHHLLAAQKIPGFFKSSKKQQAALIDLTFNMGPSWFQDFPAMMKAMQEGDYEEAARQLEFADPDNRPGVKSKWYGDVKSRRANPIINLIRDKNIDADISPHLRSIIDLLSKQSNNLSNSIASISMDAGENDEPIIVPVPQNVARNLGGSGSGTKYIFIEGGSKELEKLKKSRLAAV